MRTTPSAVFVDTVSSWLYWNTPILLPYKSSAPRTALSQYSLTLNSVADREKGAPRDALPMSVKAGTFVILPTGWEELGCVMAGRLLVAG